MDFRIHPTELFEQDSRGGYSSSEHFPSLTIYDGAGKSSKENFLETRVYSVSASLCINGCLNLLQASPFCFRYDCRHEQYTQSVDYSIKNKST